MVFRILVLGLACAAVVACAPGTEYRNARVIEPMKTPPDLPFEGGEPLYTVPRVEQRKPYDPDDDKFQPPEPPQLRAPVASADEETAPAPDARIESVLTRDGNGYPIIMMRTRFAWAWDRVDEALQAARLTIDDRDRDAGLFYLDLRGRDNVDAKRPRLKLSQTANGIQVALIQRKSEELLDKSVAQPLLKRLHEQL